VDFLLDENIDPAIGEALRSERPEIKLLRVGDLDAPAPGVPDPGILNWCQDHRCALVTSNRSTMPVHLRSHLAAGRHVPGIFVLSHGTSVREIVADLELIWDAARPGEFDDQIVYLPL
jgi:hypothetical protein